MAQLGSKKKPARVRVQTEERGMELVALCNLKGWQVIVGIEPDKEENIDDIKELGVTLNRFLHFNPGLQEMQPAHVEVVNNINAVAETRYETKTLPGESD